MSYTQQFQQGVSNTVVRSAVDSAVYGTDFEDNLVFNDSSLQMRKYVKDNFDYAGKNGEVVPDNVKSVGVNGDGVKLEGSHPEKIIENGIIIGTKDVIAPTGGAQMGGNLLFDIPIEEGSVLNHTVAHFAGPHDFLSSWNYENIDINGETLTVLKDNGTLVNIASGLLLVPSIPLAAAPFIQNNINEISNINFLIEDNEKK